MEEDVFFNDPNNQVVAARVDDSTGLPTSYAIKAFGRVVSGEMAKERIAVGDFVKFRKVNLTSTNIAEITSVMDEDGNINEKLLESEILKNDPTGLFTLERDLEEIGLAEVDAAETGDVGGVGDASGAENLNQGTDYGLGGESGLGDYGGTGIQATTSGFGHVGLGNNTRPNNELYGISDKLSQIYEDLLLELEGQGKTEIIERLNATDFGFQTRFERRIVPIN